MIVHSPTLSSVYGVHARGMLKAGMYTGTHGDRERTSPTELSLCSHPLNRRKRCTSARNSVKHAAANSISRRIGSLGSAVVLRVYVQIEDRKMRNG